MLKEAIDTICTLAVEAAGPQIRAHDPYEPSATIDSHGNTVIDPGRPRPRKHVALDLGTNAEFAKRFDSAAIWYSRKAVVALIDDNIPVVSAAWRSRDGDCAGRDSASWHAHRPRAGIDGGLLRRTVTRKGATPRRA